MTQRKGRLTVTVDPELIDAGTKAVAQGWAGSLSGWVNAALVDRAERDRKLEALAVAIADYEADFGHITEAEMAAVARVDREAALVVRGRRSQPQRSGKSARGGR
jgi:hypothetical protein